MTFLSFIPTQEEKIKNEMTIIVITREKTLSIIDKVLGLPFCFKDFSYSFFKISSSTPCFISLICDLIKYANRQLNVIVSNAKTVKQIIKE